MSEAAFYIRDRKNALFGKYFIIKYKNMFKNVLAIYKRKLIIQIQGVRVI